MADITKGKNETHRKETIDTGASSALRIREAESTIGQQEYTIPETVPRTHTNASTKAAALRLREETADSLVQKATDTVKISMLPYYTPFRTQIQAFLAKIAFFVNIDG